MTLGSCLLIVKDLTVESNIAFWPADFTFIDVEELYPIPVLTTFTSVTLPLDITGFNLAPAPNPVGSIISKSGTEKYSLPPKLILTEVIWPFLIFGTMDAFLPFLIDIIGFLWLLTTVDPYPVPSSYR